ncbi:MAG: peptide/nickel transport system substrate-binding protein, partial [Thermomicrobiales bacterium]|nr:peptide/nickel transport system substrate-binding protein [Thermomicrobiales bacterium]
GSACRPRGESGQSGDSSHAGRAAGAAGASGGKIRRGAVASAQEVKKGGTLVSMLVAEPTSMDIASGTGQHNYAVMSNVFENLLQYDPVLFDARPCLAESYDVSADGMVYTFHLRPNVVFHDGTPMNAEAVQFSYQRIMDPENEYYKLGQPFPLIDFWYEAIDPKGIVVQDELTVVFNLKKPHSTLDAFLAWPAAAIVSPTAVKKYGADFRTNPVGTGPFQFKEWVPNQKVEFTRFDQYWGGPAALDGIVFRPIIEEQTRVTELQAGNIDFAYDLPPDNVAPLKEGADFHYYEAPLGHVWFLTLNTKAGPTADPKVRQAIAHAIDKQSIIHDILKDTGVVATGPIPSSISYAYTDQVPQYAYDPEKAKALLAEAGHADGFETRFWVPQSGSGMQSPTTMGQAIQANLGEAGINAKIEVFEWGAYIESYAKGLPDDVGMAECSWFATDARNIPNLTLSCGTVSPAGYNAGYYCNQEVDSLIAQFTNTLDRDQQAQIMAQLQTVVATDVPNVYVDTQLGTAALSNKYDGFDLHPSQLLRFYSTHLV